MLNCLKGRISQYIFCSSIAVCSQPPAYWPITEEHEKCASYEENVYGYDKWLAEEYLFQQFKECDLAASIVRPVYVYGPYDYSGRLDYFFSSIANDIPIVLSGNGENIIQFGYVYDLCRAIIAMIGNESAYGQAFNISGRELVTVNQFIKLISLEIGKMVDVKFNIDGQFNMNESSTLTSRHRFADINKAEKLIGIIPKTSLVEGIKETTQWWLTNRRLS
jgi:dTDP-glucose 4,6-dehydratase